jgi:cytochrome bd-type quinol oxidase subunit 2
MKEEGKLSTCHVNFAFAVAALALAAAIALIVMLGVYDYVGFTGTIPISLSTCTSNYFSLKYGSFLTNMVEATFVISLFAVLIASILFIILLMWVVAICKGSLPNESISLNSKIILYILSSLLVLSAIIPFGYHLSYAIELNNCTGSSNSNQLIGLLIVALALFILALLLWILLIVAYCRN